MRTFSEYIAESMEDAYRYKFNWNTYESEDDEGEIVYDYIGSMQRAFFNTRNGDRMMWYARENTVQGSSGTWDIAFGIMDQNKDESEDQNIDIKKTGRGDAFGILATVAAITAEFVEVGYEEGRVGYLRFHALEKNRANLYIKRLIPKVVEISGIDVEVERIEDGGEYGTDVVCRVGYSRW
jgi:hypothetical protein